MQRTKWIKKDELSPLHKKIVEIAQRLHSKNRFVDMLTLFEVCCKELPNPEPEIDQVVRDLHQMKYIVPGKQLFKEDILTNETRRKIYEYILANPGAHEREIRTAFELGSYMAYRHLTLLENFGFIRKKTYQNKSVHFPIDFNEAQEQNVLLLRHELSKKVYECIQDNEELRLTDLKEILQVPYSTLQSHLDPLVEGGVIKKIKKGTTTFYIPSDHEAHEDIVEIKREYDYIGGNIRFKVAVRNLTDMAIHNIAINLNPSEQFIVDIPQQNVANLSPSTTRGIDFMLTPLTCGTSKVFGGMTFEDAYGKVHTLPINPKEISIKCPLVQPQMASQSEVNEWLKNLKRGTGKITYQSISDEEAFRIGREQVSALDLTEVSVDSEQKYCWYSGQVKVTGQNMVVKVSIINPEIILDIWADDLKQTTGFIAFITNLITIALQISYKMVQKTEDITQKILALMKASTVIEGLFSLCKNSKLVSDIAKSLANLQQLLEGLFPDSPLISSIKDTNTNLMASHQPDSLVKEQFEVELQFKLLNWLHKVSEMIQSYINTYQDTFDDINQISGELNTGLHLIKQKIQEHEKIYGLGIISYLLILDKKSGISFFEKNFGDLHINPDLVGGFLHALQSFGTELSEAETSMKTLTYENYQFQIETGSYVRIALILRGTPNDFVRAGLQEFLKQFEKNFEEDVKTFTGNIQAFGPAGALFSAIFK